MVVGGQRGGNSIGGSKRSVVDQSWVSLSLSLTLDNMLNSTVLGNIRWAIGTIGHSSVVVGAVVAGHGVAGNGTDKGRSNMAVGGQRGSNSSDSRGSNSLDKRRGNMAVGGQRGGNSSDSGGSNIGR